MARVRARITSVGTEVPASSYSQAEVLDLFAIEDPQIRSLFLGGGIRRRHLVVPPAAPDGTRRVESQGELLRKHRAVGVEIGARAVEACLKEEGSGLSDVRFLCCVSSTGLLTPGLSARLIKELGIDPRCSRLDVVGMG